MRMYDLIHKKRDGHVLSDEEIAWMIEGYTTGDIPDYQMSAMLMAIYFQGLDSRETAVLTHCMARSGDMVDLSAIPGIKVDKHSTGGVGDKTSLIIGPIVASCGVPVAKMSGRGLGHSGGTVDKLESIPGLETAIEPQRFLDIVNNEGIAIIGQSGNLAPADKKLYALRDVTATVESIPLIAASVMSKKIAAGSDCILLDVKMGSGAFMKTLEDSLALAKTMVEIGEQVGRHTVALVTDMDRPLGYAVGNALEVMEAIDTLRGNGPEDLTDICIQLAANMLYLAEKGELEECVQLAADAIASGRALDSLRRMIAAQGGDPSVVDDFSRFPLPGRNHVVDAPASGYITHMDTERCGIASVMLGAGRQTKEDDIDYTAGIVLLKKVGEKVEQGQPIAMFYAETGDLFPPAEKTFLSAISIGEVPPEPPKLVYARVTKAGVEQF